MSLVRTVSAGEIYAVGSVSTLLRVRGPKKTHQFPVWLRRLAPAEVAECPSSIPQHAEFVVFAEQLQKRPQGALPKNVISALWAVASNVAQGPDCLLPDVQD